MSRIKRGVTTRAKHKRILEQAKGYRGRRWRLRVRSSIMTGAASTMARDDTLLGACYAVGEDFGFNPLYLRLLFAFGLLSSPAIALTAYAALTALVTLTRWLVPDPVSAQDAECFDEPCEELRLAA